MSDHDTLIELNIEVKQIKEDMQEITKEVKELTTALTKYKGAVGGIMLAGSLISAAIALGFQFLKLKVTG